MGQYERYLKDLLQPLGIYDMTEGGPGESELYALGKALDAVSESLEKAERETILATAEEEGLRRREELFLLRSVAQTPEQRRAAVIALMQIDQGSLTPEAINRTLRGCGIRAMAKELDTGHLQVRFPDVSGIPDDFEQIRAVILDILPCHLETEFFFRYMTWEECETQKLTWAMIEAANHTWETFEKAVLPEK